MPPTPSGPHPPGPDPHSYANPRQRNVQHVSWTVSVDLERHVLDAVAVLHLGLGTGPVDLDTRDLDITAVADVRGRTVPYELADRDPVLGSRLRLHPAASSTAGTTVRIAYRTSPASTALQWLTPEQTADGTHPYVYSQCQTIHARSMLPVPDSPSRRFTYDARVDVPTRLHGGHGRRGTPGRGPRRSDHVPLRAGPARAGVPRRPRRGRHHQPRAEPPQPGLGGELGHRRGGVGVRGGRAAARRGRAGDGPLHLEPRRPAGDAAERTRTAAWRTRS